MGSHSGGAESVTSHSWFEAGKGVKARAGRGEHKLQGGALGKGSSRHSPAGTLSAVAEDKPPLRRVFISSLPHGRLGPVQIPPVK